jgi:flagellar protein FlaG
MNILRIGPIDPRRAAGLRLDEAAAAGDHSSRQPPQAARRPRRAEDQQNPDSALHRVAYSYDEDANRYVMKLIDSETGQVIRQIPPEELLRVAAEINRYLGVILDTKS